MRAVLFLALTAAASATQPPFVQFAEGLIMGIEPTLGGKTAPCLMDNDAAFKDVRIGFQMIENGLTTQNLTTVYNGVLQMQTAYVAIKQAAIDCNDAQLVTLIDQLVTAIGTDPLGVLASLFPYLREVVEMLSVSVQDFKSGNFTGAGYNLGQVLGLILTHDNVARSARAARFSAKAVKVGVPSASSPRYVQFLNGILTSVEPAIAGNISVCIPETDMGAMDVDQAIILLEAAVQNKSIPLLLQAAADAEAGLALLRQASAACGYPTAAADFAKIISDLETNPLGVAYRLLPYAAEIFSDIDSGVAAWKAMQWNAAGVSFGAVLARVLQTAP